MSGAQFDFVWLPARGEPNEIKKDTHPKNITALFTGRPVEVVLGDDGVDGLARQGKGGPVSHGWVAANLIALAPLRHAPPP